MEEKIPSQENLKFGEKESLLPEVVEKLERGECAYYPREGHDGFLYIPYEKTTRIKNPHAKEDFKLPFGHGQRPLSRLHEKIFGVRPLGIGYVGNKVLMQILSGATPEQLIDLIDTESAE